MQISLQQFRKSMKAIIVVTVFLAIATTFFLQRTSQRTPMSVTVTQVRTVSKPLNIERAGLVVHATMVPVYTEGAGRVNDVYVTAGQVVKAGQPLIKLDITGGDSKVMVASNSTPVEVSSASKDIYEKALNEYNRYKKLYEQGAIARKQLETAEGRLQAAQAGMQGSQEGMTIPERPVTTVVNGPVTIQSPIDGTITGSVVAAGSTVTEGQELMSLGSGQDVEIVVPLEQSELYFIQLGSKAVIEVAGQQLAGQVSGIYPEVKDKQIASFMAHIKLSQPPGDMLPLGMSITVRIATGQEVGTIAIPAQAVLRDAEGQYFIFFDIEGKAIRQQVTVGEVIGDLLEVTSAIPQDSLVITTLIDQLKNGDTITVLE
ncbi:efflux RND transporter periplasmic adaptor subunit [Pelosinus sp. IPA-1]|uniref:efflux RND transporter periplasmic adaptor subunit n=1 Tax=Pelosinus sp. IPA-1 TaxID=3029569 RepID=UPI0024361C45|nr:efflux RND transporter periplasmic adaptor subunit [Pelosinus sp. IPA-1]GMA99578.1 RND transporter [Pelosinus sp. IPA-1]